MKVNKEEILYTARRLFNQKGLAAVTARVISAELNISPGSFSYHFPDSSRLIVELYRSMLGEMNVCLLNLKNYESSIKPFLETFQKCAHIQLKYKFIFLHLSEILIKFPAIRQMHRKSIMRERELAYELFEHYLSDGVLNANTSKRDLKRIFKQCQILFAYWPVDAQLKNFNSEDQAVYYYSEVCCSAIKPYLNNNSKKEFDTYFQKHIKLTNKIFNNE